MRSTYVRMGIIAFFVSSSATALADPVNNPSNASGAKEFNWQKEWGSIHMNSFADGLNDPGIPATNTGDVPCPNPTGATGDASICNTVPIPSAGYATISNGIKYDIKNSLNNCMAKAVPNWSLGNSWDSDINTYGPCTNALPPVSSLSNLNDANGTKFIHDYTGPDTKWRASQKALATSIRGNDGRKILTFLPIYDARSNDARAWGTGGPGAFVGCQQQIANNCGIGTQGEIIRDIHQCVASPVTGPVAPSPGYRNPVSHVFTPQEVSDLKASLGLKDSDAAALPTVYWAYQVKTKDKDDKDIVRTALSAVDPATFNPDQAKGLVDGSIEKIDTRDPSNTVDKFLSNLKSYRFETTEGDLQKFVVMDPKDFFDLKLYVTGGEHDAAYENQPTKLPDGTIKSKMIDAQGMVQTFNTCPVQGITNGYGGICDPTGRAGCNLPIYGQSEATVFNVKDSQDNEYTYTNYPLKWSGYALSWAILSRDKYLQNICGSAGCSPYNNSPTDREDYYIISEEEGLNANPVIMVKRSTDYCEVAEMASNPRQQLASSTSAALQANMDCYQYLQYQKWTDENGVDQWSFVDLYNPTEALFDKVAPENDVVRLFDLDNNGDPDYTKPVKGTGPNRFVADMAPGAGNNYVRLIDAVDPEGNGTAAYSYFDTDGSTKSAVVATYKDANGTLQHAVAQDRVAVKNTIGDDTTGKYLMGLDAQGNFCNPGKGTDPSCKPDPGKGTGLSLVPGTATAIRMKEMVTITGADGKPKDTSCVIIGYMPPRNLTVPKTDPNYNRVPQEQMFIPTNTMTEFKAFITAMQAKDSPVEGAKFWDCSAGFQSKAETKVQLAHEGVPDPNNFTDAFNGFTFKTWAGTMACKDVAHKPACNQVRMISAQRRCQLENGALGQCGDCAAATDPDATKISKFAFDDSQVGGAVLTTPKPGDSNCYFSASCFAESSDGCPPAGVPGGHVFCLSPDTKISMAGGKEKAIKDVKAGDKVLAFNAKETRSGAMGTAVVKATAITKNQEVIQINGLKITPLHKVVLATGRAVLAKEVKVGDKLLKGNGQVEPVTAVKTLKKRITVYNLVLDKESDGYIAGGIKVMSYPLMKEMEVISGQATAKAKSTGATRKVSSLKQAK